MASQWEHIKWIPGTRLMVDGFRFQNPACKSYLLTHFHSDHTTGLTKSFNSGLIFCTQITARLLRKDMGMPPERICELEMDKPRLIEGVEVTPIDANHCPGACMFLLKTRAGPGRKAQTILHTGDLRWSSKMALHPALRNQRIDYLFLDTTYAKPAHTHPPQEICIHTMAKIMREEIQKNPRTLFVCGSYHIGKERAYLGAAKLLGWKVWCDANKRRVLKMLDLPDDLMMLLCTKPKDARIHVDFLGGLQPERLQQRISPTGSWTHVVAFRPTGWTYRRSGKQDVRQEGNVKIYGIPYSEHSSFPELRDCVASLRPLKLVPTVNATNHAAAENIISRFADLMDLSEDKSRLDFFMRKRQKLESCGEMLLKQGSLPADAQQSNDSCNLEDRYEEPTCCCGAEYMPCKIEDSNLPSELPFTPREAKAPPGSNFIPLQAPVPQLTEKPGQWSGKESYQEAAVPGIKNEPELSQSPFSVYGSQQDAEGLSETLKSEAAPPLGAPGLPAGNPSGGPSDLSEACRECGSGLGIQVKDEVTAQPLKPAEAPSGHPPVLGFRRQRVNLATAGDLDSAVASPSWKLQWETEQQSWAWDAMHMLETPATQVPAFGSCAEEVEDVKVEDPGRADSNRSCTEHVEIDVATIDVLEQEKILQAIVAERQKMELEIAKSLTKTRQSSLAAFLRR